MNLTYRIAAEAEYYKRVQEQVRELFSDIDEETLADTVDGLTDLHEMLGAVIRSQLEDTLLAKALRERMSEMQARLSRIEYRSDQKRDLVRSVMEEVGIKKIAAADLTISLKSSRPALQVTDESVIPGEFWKPQPAKLDRQGLSVALSTGREIPGAILGNPAMTISVRTK